MLTCLQIRDFAIVQELTVEFGPGLNVVTGETGAGKSVVIGALELVLGGRGRAEHVRAGAARAEVEALFDVRADAALKNRLREMELGGDEELVVRRVVHPGGSTKAFVNGRLATREDLAELTRGLADISSQHQHHTLTDPGTHLGYLDAFASLANERSVMREAYLALERAQSRLDDFEQRLLDRHQRHAMASAAVSEIEAVLPRRNEDFELEEQARQLRSAETLLRLTAEAADLLYERDGSSVDTLARAEACLADAADIDAGLLPLSVQLQEARAQLEDAARELGRRLASIRPDPDTLEQVEERLHALSKLKRRYGNTLEAVLLHLDNSRAELTELENGAETADTLTEIRDKALGHATRSARELSLKRHRAASKLARAISVVLASLGMGEARIQVDVSERSGGLCVDGKRLGPEGMDRAEFLIAPNPGEEARSLRRVASGGELSRAMLAIKCVLADLGPAGLYAFDEVDSGVGGAVAEVIGRKIHEVSKHRQVLCVTHLPQIAVFADQHFKVEKTMVNRRTCSNIRKLSPVQQREEIARMLGGLRITSKTRAAAREMLEGARCSAA